MDISEIFGFMEKIDNGEPLPEGWNEQNVITRLVEDIDILADENDRLKAAEIVTAERAKQFADTKKVAMNETKRFKAWMVHCFNGQEGKKFPGKNFTANIVRKSAMKPNREPKFSDYTNKDRMKFVVADFEWKEKPNADVFAALKAAGLGEFCGYKFSWDNEVIKKSDPEETSSFCDVVDSSYVQFKPKKG